MLYIIRWLIILYVLINGSVLNRSVVSCPRLKSLVAQWHECCQTSQAAVERFIKCNSHDMDMSETKLYKDSSNHYLVLGRNIA